MTQNNELDRQVAIAQGWIKKGIYWVNGADQSEWGKVDEYHPTADTVEGRSQCFDLVIKYKLSISPYPSIVDGVNGVYQYNVNSVHDKSLQVAIVKAAILASEVK